MINREIRLTAYQDGLTPSADNFLLAETPVAAPGPGEILVRNVLMSVDPYMLGRMLDRESYVPPFALGAPLDGHAIGEVVESNGHPDFMQGDYVLGMQGWREWFVSDGAGLGKVNRDAAPLEAHLGIFGPTGFTAYVGLKRIAAVKPGDRVFVSAAAGAVGSAACQIAKAMGCYVVGSAGSDEKCDWLRDIEVDGTLNYRDCPDPKARLAELFPGGIDAYFDNVGGRMLDAAIANMRLGGHIALCGLMARENEGPAPGPEDLTALIVKNLTLRGFMLGLHADMKDEFEREMRGWIADGTIIPKATVREGIAAAPEAFVGLIRGDNIGKMLVRLGPDAA